MADNIAEDLLAAQRLEQAVRLRSKGAHWSEVAEACGYPSPRAALQAVGEAMAAATLRAEMTADQMRDEATLRLEHLFREALGMTKPERHVSYDENGNEVVADDRSVRLKAVDEARRLVESMNKLNGVGPAKADEGEGVPTIRIVGIRPEDLV